MMNQKTAYYRALLALNHLLSDMRFNQDEKEKFLNRYYYYYQGFEALNHEVVQELGEEYEKMTCAENCNS